MLHLERVLRLSIIPESVAVVGHDERIGLEVPLVRAGLVDFFAVGANELNHATVVDDATGGIQALVVFGIVVAISEYGIHRAGVLADGARKDRELPVREPATAVELLAQAL